MPSETLTNYPMVPVLEHVKPENTHEVTAEPKKPPVRYPADRHGEKDTFYDKLYGLLTNGGRRRSPIQDLTEFRGALWYEGLLANPIREKYKWLVTTYLFLLSPLVLFAYATQEEQVADVYAAVMLLSMPVALVAFYCTCIFINCRTGSEDAR